MSGVDFDKVALLWRGQPSPEDEALMRMLARRVSRTAIAIQYFDVVLAALLVVAVIVSLYLEPAPATAVIGLLIVGVIVWSSWRRHLLARASLTLDARDREALLTSAVEAVRASLRRSRIGIWSVFPGYLLSIVFKYSYYMQGDLDGFGELVVEKLRSGWGAASLVVIVAMQIIVMRSHRRLRREAESLEALRNEYRRESRLDTLSGS